MEEISEKFRRFADFECSESSPLYKHLSLNIANDSELLTLASFAQHGQPVPNLFLAAVHFLLLKGYKHPLSKFYPSIFDVEFYTEDPFPYFRSFCFEHYTEIQNLISSRRVQTNEVKRCACLLPAFAFIARQVKERPLFFIEIGSSAGLNLLWHRYRYNYGNEIQWGDVNSPVQINCSFQGNKPLIQQVFPKIVSCVGIDLNPINLSDPNEVLWLRALIWPEHKERVNLLNSAIQVARANALTIIAGDAIKALPEILASVPEHVELCIFHTFTLNQFSPDASEKLFSLLAQHSFKQHLFVISIEMKAKVKALVEITFFERGVKTSQSLAYCSPYGEWIEWLVN
jgi:hypothetical protein